MIKNLKSIEIDLSNLIADKPNIRSRFIACDKHLVGFRDSFYNLWIEDTRYITSMIPPRNTLTDEDSIYNYVEINPKIVYNYEKATFAVKPEYFNRIYIHYDIDGKPERVNLQEQLSIYKMTYGSKHPGKINTYEIDKYNNIYGLDITTCIDEEVNKYNIYPYIVIYF